MAARFVVGITSERDHIPIPAEGVDFVVNWYAGDDEFGPSAAILLPRNIVSLMCIEDVVVMSEQLVRRLAGKPS